MRWLFKETGTGPDNLKGLLHVGSGSPRLCVCQIQGMLQDFPRSQALHPTNLSGSLAGPAAAKASQASPETAWCSQNSPSTLSGFPGRAPGEPQHGLCSVGLVLATALWLRQPLASSTVQELCDNLSSMPEILDKVLTELATLLHNQWCNPRREGTRASHRAVSCQERP